MNALISQCSPLRTHAIQPKRKGEREHAETRSNIRESTAVAGKSEPNNEEATDDLARESDTSKAAELGT
jgi:hypothetical protein